MPTTTTRPSTPSLARRPAQGVNVFLVGSRPVLREGLGRCLRARGCEVIGEAPASPDTLRQVLALRPHVVVVDVAAGERAPFDLVRRLTAADRRQRVLVVACHDDPGQGGPHHDVVEQAWDTGAHGLVNSAATADHLARAVEEVRGGVRHLPPRPSPTGVTPPLGMTLPSLTVRERQVLECLASGLSTVEAARELLLSPATVKHHLGSAHRKLGARSRTEAVMLAVTHGLIQLTPAGLTGRSELTQSSRVR